MLRIRGFSGSKHGPEIDILTEIIHFLPQSLQVNAEEDGKIRPRQLASTYFLTRCSLFVLIIELQNLNY
jgi:hypothetical protein